LAGDLGEAAPEHASMPPGLLLWLAGSFVFPWLASGDAQRRDGSAGLSVAYFSVGAEVADQLNLIEGSHRLNLGDFGVREQARLCFAVGLDWLGANKINSPCHQATFPVAAVNSYKSPPHFAFLPVVVQR
jgi:hypothetical protein